MSRKNTGVRVGIVGVSGYGGGELLRYLVGHPVFKITYAAGEASAGQRLGQLFPWAPAEIADLEIESFEPHRLAETVDLLFLSLPTSASRSLAEEVPDTIKVIDLGGDHRFAEGWTYGLADVHPDAIARSTRIANPGCYPSAALTALVPLVAAGLLDPADIQISATSGLSGTGRGSKEAALFADYNEDTAAYGFFDHPHIPEIEQALQVFTKSPVSRITFVPQYIPTTRGILAVCFGKGTATADDCLKTARDYYRDRPFVQVTDQSPHTKHAAGTNAVLVSYRTDPQRKRIVALGAIDNLGKGAAGQAVQNANLMSGFDATTGLTGVPVSW